jgi:hypothetical protein
MRGLCYVIGFIIAVAVIIIPLVIAPITYISIIVSAAGAVMIGLLIWGLATGRQCMFGKPA